MISLTSLKKRKAPSKSKSAQTDNKNSISSTALLDSKVAMPTNLNRKASQEPESCCLPGSLKNSQEPISAPKINSGKPPHLSLLTKSRMSARLNPPNKYLKIGNLIAVPTGNMVLVNNNEIAFRNNGWRVRALTRGIVGIVNAKP